MPDVHRTVGATLVETDQSVDIHFQDGPALKRGQEVGRYVVLELLGAGGMGIVYSAYDPELDRKVALKVLRGESGGDESKGKTRLLREAQALARVSHPNVVAVHDVGTHKGRVFLAMSFVRGPTLSQWRANSERTWKEVLEVYLAAAEGLMAVHQSGLVHRDFKPDNVMIDRTGRVQVMDFGLAREELDVERSDPPQAVGDGLATPLTVTGAVLGTPAYMAPEQHLGLPADAMSDQFSFCVALYEGLYAERPFQGSTLASLGVAISEGRFRDAPKGSQVPSWVRRVVKRGLSSTPEERWPSMEALCEALRADPVRKRRRWLATGAGLLAVAGLGGALASAFQGEDSSASICTGSKDAVAKIWSSDRAESLDAAFRASGLPFAEDSARSVRVALDEWSQTWASVHREACEATRIRGTQSDRMLDRRMACLQSRLDDAASVLDVLESASPEAVEGAVQAATGLPSVAPCADMAALERGLEPPADPATRAAVDAIRDQLRGARATLVAGNPALAQSQAEASLAKAIETHYAPLVAEAELDRGKAALEAADYKTAEDSLARAYFVGLEQGHEVVTAEAAAQLVYVIGYRRQQPDRGLGWVEHAEALVRRVDPGGPLEALAAMRIGGVLDGKGQNDAAEARYRRALEIHQGLHGGNHPDVASALNNIGNTYLGRGQLAPAGEYYRRAVAMREALFGRSHPEVAGSLNNLSLVERRKGNHEEAFKLLTRAVQIYEAAYGDHADTSQTLTNVAIELVELGRLEEAETAARDALRMRRKVLREGHPDLGDTELVLADVADRRAQHDEALKLRLAALRHYEGSFDTAHPAVFAARVAVARSKLALGHGEEARELVALAIDKGAGAAPPADVAAARGLLESADQGSSQEPKP